MVSWVRVVAAASPIVPVEIVPWNPTTTSIELAANPVGTYNLPITGYDVPSIVWVSPSVGTIVYCWFVIVPDGLVDPTAVLIAAWSVASCVNAACKLPETSSRVTVGLPGIALISFT